MSSARLSRERYERNHIRDCARCGRRASKAANWSDGPICRTCLHKAENTHGTCPHCGAARLLPGRDSAGAAICRDCAGITRNFFCSQCGSEGQLYAGRLCTRCSLTDLVTVVFDDGTGSISPALRMLADRLIASPNPKSTWTWLQRSHVRGLITDLARGTIPLTHEALHGLPNWRTVAHLRDLLMASEALPQVDKQILHHETWLAHRYAELAADQHERLLRAFATWHQLPRMRARAAIKPLTPGSRTFAGEQFKTAHAFLSWLDTSDEDLATCTQAMLDAWHATHSQHQHNSLRVFLRWAMSNGHMPKLRIPTPTAPKAAPMSQRRRLQLLRRAVTDEHLDLPTRVAACLMLLYAQPITRIVRLTLDDLTHHNGELHLRLGDPPTPVPEPFATLLLKLANDRPHLNTATNSGARWLIPGRRAGQPANPSTIREHLRRAGFLTGTARPAALRHLVLQAPAPVIAQSLGYHHVTTTRVAAEAGGSWNRYAPNDHSE
ncbi:hypothetical protein [Actinoallomurus iriomotensis]|uniref:Recombinase XerD n=1 Tax=Actinoallomurus iriomotensis TaxID=478107 RepID=A0A9W6W6J3_9ACTN|nr:hypothetical protein [Actinoallomurus iriomotensis]GLY92529.1 hypothetical protein Airi02_104570 [Actinoallomurus iriomotensis]